MQIQKQIDGNVNGNVNGTANGSTDCDLNRFSNGDSHSRKDLAVLMLISGSSANAKAVCLRHNRIPQCVQGKNYLVFTIQSGSQQIACPSTTANAYYPYNIFDSERRALAGWCAWHLKDKRVSVVPRNYVS